MVPLHPCSSSRNLFIWSIKQVLITETGAFCFNSNLVEAFEKIDRSCTGPDPVPATFYLPRVTFVWDAALILPEWGHWVAKIIFDRFSRHFRLFGTTLIFVIIDQIFFGWGGSKKPEINFDQFSRHFIHFGTTFFFFFFLT